MGGGARVVLNVGGDATAEEAALLQELLPVFTRCIGIAMEKDAMYQGAWRSQGWMGNLARILSKTARLKAMCWVDLPLQDRDETVEDTALDLINLAAFFFVNRRNHNRWGESR